MPSLGLADDTAEREERYQQQFEQQRLQDRMETKQAVEQQEDQQGGSIQALRQETDSTIRLFRLVTALNPLTFIWYVLETTLRYLTANIMGFEWPGVWQKVSKIERWVMFGTHGLLLIVFIISVTLMVFLQPGMLLRLGLEVVFSWLKDLGCQIYSCSQ